MSKNVSQCIDANKWPTDANFQSPPPPPPPPTGRKVEMDSANAGLIIIANIYAVVTEMLGPVPVIQVLQVIFNE